MTPVIPVPVLPVERELLMLLQSQCEAWETLKAAAAAAAADDEAWVQEQNSW